MAKKTVLVIEDDKNISELICHHLEREGFNARRVSDGSQALLEIGSRPPDLILLDLMLPGTDGFQIMKQISARPETKETPVIMVTAKDDEADIVKGLELGADDYVTKPFSPKVLLARVKAVMRRKKGAKAKTSADTRLVTSGPLAIDPGRHKAELDGKAVDLTLTEFNILYFLAKNPGWVFTRSQIVEAVRGDAYHVTDRSIDVLVFGLRKKLIGQEDLIETVRGIGYRFRDTEAKE